MSAIEITQEELQKRRLFVGVPMFGAQCEGSFAKSMNQLTGLCLQEGIHMQPYYLFNESLIARARNYISDEFMRSDCTHLLFIDADISFNANDVLHMLALQSDDSPYDILCACYPKKSISWSKIKTAVERGFGDDDPKILSEFVGDYVFNPVEAGNIPIHEPAEVSESGTGFMMIRRKTFEKFAEAYPQQHYLPDHVYNEHFDGSREIVAYFDCPIDHKLSNLREELEIYLKNNPEASHDDIYKFCTDPNSDASRPYSKRYLSEDYHFCIDGNSNIATEIGNIKMSKIVKDKMNIRVWSLDKDNKLELKPIKNWSSKKDKQKKWVKIRTTTDNPTKPILKCTSDHKVAYIDNVFKDDKIKFTEAENLKDKYIIRYNDKNKKLKENRLFNNEQISFLIGTLLGDSSISKSGQICYTHCDTQKEYFDIKNKIFHGKGISYISEGKGFSRKGNISHNGYSPINEQTRQLREMIYIDGKKSIRNIIDMIDEKSLAFWYCDDGHFSGYNAQLYTCSFSYDDHILLKDLFKSKWDIDVDINVKKVKYKNENKEYYILNFRAKELEKLFNLISKYIPFSMQYKIPDKFKNNIAYNFDTNLLDYAASRVENVEFIDKKLTLYDIEVEDNHNFFANSSLVHNCQWSRKIGMKVWICPWIRLVHWGKMPFGGSLEALAAIQASPTVDEGLVKKR